MIWGDLNDDCVGKQVIVRDPRPWYFNDFFGSILGWVKKIGEIYILEEWPNDAGALHHFSFWAEVQIVDG